jgi:hypothetical protein
MAISSFRVRSASRLLGFCATFLASVSGCSGLWGGRTRADPDNCVVTPELCGATQRCNLTSETCEDSPLDMAAPVNPGSYIFPGGAGGVVTTLTWPRDVKYSLAALDPAVPIYYTTDGSPPSPGQAGTTSGMTPTLGSIVPGGTVIRFFANYGAGLPPDPVHSFTAVTDPTPPQSFGYIPEPLRFIPMNKPVMTAAPGAQVSSQVTVQLWSSTPSGYCPTCIVQYVVSVVGVGAVACVPDVDLVATYPGVTMPVNVNFTAPMQRGVYKIVSGITLQFSCDGTVSNGPEIGALIVE